MGGFETAGFLPQTERGWCLYLQKWETCTRFRDDSRRTRSEIYRRHSMKILQVSRAGRTFVRRLFADDRSPVWLVVAMLTLVLGCVSVSYTTNALAQDSFGGQWLIEYLKTDDHVQLTMRYESNKN